MKKKIAMFANNWNSDNITSFLEGFKKALPKEYADIFMFLASNTYGRPDDVNESECSIHFLPDLKNFDAAVIFSQGLNSNEVREKIYEKCREAGILTVCVGDKQPDFYGVLVDNVTGMKELCKHLHEDHNVQKIKYFAGAKENDDSNIRMQAIIDFSKENGLEFSEEKDVLYTNWEIRSTMNYITNVYRDKTDLPDAFVFANDFLAIASATGLEKNGYNVPGDIRITGFDYVMSGKTFYPSISTVDQRFDIQGDKSAEVIVNVLDGKEVERYTYVPSEFIPGESCGCDSPRKEDMLRRDFCHNLISKNMEDNARENVLNKIRDAFQHSKRFSNLPDELKNVFNGYYGEDIETVHILFDPLFENIIQDETKVERHDYYPDIMHVLVSKADGIETNISKIAKKDLIPGYTGTGDNEIYVFMPLFLDSYVCGYMIMGGTDYAIKKWIYHDYVTCLNTSIGYYQTTIQLTTLNDKLSELMQTDALTSLKNRTAFENSKQMLRNHYMLKDDVRFAIVMFDLNNLKKVNDEFGHGAGDVYIKNSSELICNTFKHSPIFRIGGDEFVAIVKNSDYEIRNELLEKFRRNVSLLQGDEIPIVKRVSVASGMADYDEIENDDIETIFKLADERMYANKKEMKVTR